MNKITHPIEPEELMAHLDGELSEEREASVAAHLKECRECQKAVDEFRMVSKSLQSWEVNWPERSIPLMISTALENPGVRAAGGKLRGAGRAWWPRKWTFVLAGGAMAVLLLATLMSPSLFRVRQYKVSTYAGPPSSDLSRPNVITRQEAQRTVNEGALSAEKAQSAEGYLLSPSTGLAGKTRQLVAAQKEGLTAESASRGVTGPMIIRTAQLALITKDFDKARESVEAILKRHRGYIGELKVGGSTGSGRTLTGTLRVPADQLDATIGDLKPLGRVESESQSGQDVTSQYVDLQARLTNARNTEQRLTDLLRNRTGKLSDVLEVEQEVDRVRGEIEQMEAERKNMSNQVSYATLNLTITEDYKAQLQVVPPSTATRLSNAAVEGYRSVVDAVLDLILFLLSTGPTILLWAAVLFLPARFAWNRIRRRTV